MSPAVVLVAMLAPALPMPARQSAAVAAPQAVCAVPTDRETTSVGLVLCDSSEPQVMRADPSIASNALIVDVVPGSRADRAGFLAGDVIHRVAGRDVSDAEQAATAMAGEAGASELLINFWRNGHPNLIRFFRQ